MADHGSGSIPRFGKATRASVARMYDAALGGKDHYQVDLDANEALMKISPAIVSEARHNRAFLGRVVHYLAREAGIRQFLDLGSGLPTQNNVHQVAQRVAPDARVVYVDHDPHVLTHGHALLASNAHTAVITADMREPEEILAHPDLRAHLDPSEPTAVLFVSVLHCIADEDRPERSVSVLLDAFPSGSYLALSHLVSDDEAAAAEFTSTVRAHADWGRVRTPEETRHFFSGLEMVEPGLVDVREWRLEEGPGALGGAGDTGDENAGDGETDEGAPEGETAADSSAADGSSAGEERLVREYGGVAVKR